MSELNLTFYGTRGSIPVPGPTTVKYGGNTACLEIKSAEGDWIVFDAGTGIRELGVAMDLSKKHNINIFISHPHWDHISGFPFFTPIFIPGNNVTIYGPGTFEKSLEEIMRGQMSYSYFPVRTEELQAKITFKELKEEKLKIGNFTIESKFLSHPVTCLGYRVTYKKEKTFVYLGDNEPYFNLFDEKDTEVATLAKDMNTMLQRFVQDADVLVTDAQYIPSEYNSHRGWGHSTTHDAVNMAIKAGIKKLFFFHHDPQRTDSQMDQIVSHYRQKIREKGFNLEIFGAMENKTYEI